jgi:GT2 family glycosyltransferase
MEDSELHARLRKRRVPIRFVPDALVVHPWKRIRDWRTHRSRHLASRRLMEALHPGGGFPGSPWRAGLSAARTVWHDHLPYACRHPVDALRTLPPVWISLAAEMWLAWRKPAAILAAAFADRK